MSKLLWQCVAIYIASTIGATSSPTSKQIPLSILNQPGSSEDAIQFGVGFDLTASYGTAAVSFPNGTIVTIAKVTAEEGYNEMLARLSLDSSRHPSPPYNNLGEVWDDMPRQTLRKARKRLGLPASPDVGHLAKLISSLRKEVEKSLGHTISSVAASTLNLAALYKEDMLDAFEYVGLEYLSIPLRYDILYETSAAYAGYGYGFCREYKERKPCKAEQESMSPEVVMAVLYTRTALTVSLSVMQSAYYLYEPERRHLVDFSLGYDARPKSSTNPRTPQTTTTITTEMEYWDMVRVKLEQIMIENPYYPRSGKVLLMGDCVGHEIFREVLKIALRNQMEEMPEILDVDAEAVGAKGAAEFAKRNPWDPYKVEEY